MSDALSEPIAFTLIIAIMVAATWGLLEGFHHAGDAVAPPAEPTSGHTISFILALGVAVGSCVYAVLDESWGFAWIAVFAAYYVRRFGRIMTQHAH